MKKENGIIIKAIGGFYYIETTDNIIECKARGKFRKNDISPFGGDMVEIEYDEQTNTGVIVKILERKNFFLRPPIANLDCIVFVVSSCDPAPSYLVIDKLIAVCEYKCIEPIIVITKGDLADEQSVFDIYNNAGFKVFRINPNDLSQISELMECFVGKITAFIGNSGVGKSTLLNSIDSDLSLQTADISKKLGRGRHTTRQVSLYKLMEGGYIADTPGFSTVDFEKYDIIKKEDLADCFREFEEYSYDCKFSDCSHTSEKGCMVCKAVEDGLISKTRHQSYIEMYNQAKNYKEWEHR